MSKLDQFHFHEIIDRTHIICSMIDDYLLDHPAMTFEMQTCCEDAQSSLCEMMQLANIEEEKLFPNIDTTEVPE